MFSHHADSYENSAGATHTENPVRRGAKTIVSSGSRVLLIRERHSDGRTFWTLPGGGVRSEESLTEGLRRELLEELRCDSVVIDSAGTFWYAHHSSPGVVSHHTVFSCSVVPPVRPVRGEGILESRWVSPERLPPETVPQVRRLLVDRSP